MKNFLAPMLVAFSVLSFFALDVYARDEEPAAVLTKWIQGHDGQPTFIQVLDDGTVEKVTDFEVKIGDVTSLLPQIQKCAEEMKAIGSFPSAGQQQCEGTTSSYIMTALSDSTGDHAFAERCDQETAEVVSKATCAVQMISLLDLLEDSAK